MAPSRAPRLGFLDACRAFAVLGMLLANMMNVFLRSVPRLLGHNEGDVLRVFDFPAAVFQFLIGVSLVLFLEKRSAQGLTPRGTQVTALRRFALLIALGVVLDGVGTLRIDPQWGVLQTLGLGGGVATLLAYLPDVPAGIAAVGMLAVLGSGGNGEVHHSPIAALAFVPLTLAGLLVGRGLGTTGPHRRFVLRTATVAVASFLLAAGTRLAGIPFNKVVGTCSFVAVASGVSATVLLATAGLETAGLRFPPWLLAMGSNALMAWVLQYVLVYYPAWLVFPAWHRLRFVPGMVAAVVALTTLSAMTVALARRGVRIPI
jgi:hypothetical protein